MFTYSLLERVMELYAGVRLDDVLVLASQHLLNDQKRMFELLLQAGLRPENCIIAGKCYSTNRGVMEDLRGRGCKIAPFSLAFDPLRHFDDWYEGNLNLYIMSELCRLNFEDYSKVIVLDDGGFMHIVVNRWYRSEPNIVGIEQTSSGHHIIRNARITFPSVSVARSLHKLQLESPFIGKNTVERIIDHLTSRKKHNPKFLVMGLGSIGRQVAGQLFLVNNFRGFATDPHVDNWDILKHGAAQLLRNQGRFLPKHEAMEKLKEFDVIIGAAGSPVLNEDDFGRLHREVSLISTSSSDREFPALAFRRRVNGGIHDDYWLGNRCLVNSGFPITFDGSAQVLPPQQIEFTIALMLIHLMDQVSNHMHPLPIVVEQIRQMWHLYENADVE